MKTPLLLLLALAGLLTSGCVQTQFTAPNGATFKTTRLFYQGEIGRAELGADGGASIENYSSESAQVAEAIARGIAAGLKP